MADEAVKYKAFRNFMANELGITRDDIKEWTIEAITAQVIKQVAQINYDAVIKGSIDNILRHDYQSLRGELIKELTRKVDVTIRS